MAKCLRCGAGNEWIEGDTKKAPTPDESAYLSSEDGEELVNKNNFLNEMLSQRSNQLQSLQQKLEEKEKEITSLNEIIAQKNKLMEKMNAEIKRLTSSPI